MVYFFLAWTFSWSCALVLCTGDETTWKTISCTEPAFIRCKCGASRNYQEFYVPSCQVNSSFCGPCPESCVSFIFCKTCSKNGCLTCPNGRRGQFCENEPYSGDKNLDYIETPDDSMKFFTREVFDRPTKFSLNSAEIPSPEEASTGSKLTKNYQKPIQIIDSTTTLINKNANQRNNDYDIGKMSHTNAFESLNNPKFKDSLSNKTEQISKSKAELKIQYDTNKMNHQDKFLATHENQTDVYDYKLIAANGSIYTMNSVGLQTVGNMNFSKNADMDFEEISKLKFDKTLHKLKPSTQYPEVFKNTKRAEQNNSSRRWMLRLDRPKVQEGNEKFKRVSPFEYLEIQEMKKFNNPYRQGVRLYESRDEQENANLEKQENTTNLRRNPVESLETNLERNIFKHIVIDDFPSEQNDHLKKEQHSEKDFDVEVIKFPPISFSLNKNKSGLSELQINSSHKSKNSKTHPILYQLNLGSDKIDFREGNVSQGSSKMQLDSTERRNPLDIRNFKMKTLKTEENVTIRDPDHTNANKKQLIVDKSFDILGKSKLFENSTKEFELISPLNINVFKITFLSEDSDTHLTKNSNQTKLDEIISASRNRLFEQPERAVDESKIANVTFKKENTGSFPVKNDLNKAMQFSEINKEDITENNKNNKPDIDALYKIITQSPEFKLSNRGANAKERTANFKRNATNKPNDDTYILYKLIMQSPEFRLGEGRKFDHTNSFTKIRVPENHILLPLYYPHIYNTELYKSKILENSKQQILCDIYPDYSSCYRVHWLTPENSNKDMNRFQSQINLKYHQHKSFSNGRFVPYTGPFNDPEDSMRMLFYTGKDQDRLTNSKFLRNTGKILKQYWQYNDKSSISSSNFKTSQLLDDALISEKQKSFSPLFQKWNSEVQKMEGFDSTFLKGIINPLFSFINPKYRGSKQTVRSFVVGHTKLYEKRPMQSDTSSEETDLPIHVNQSHKIVFIPDTNRNHYNKLFNFSEMKPEPRNLGSESLEIPLNVLSNLKQPFTFNSTQRGFSKYEEPKINESKYINEVENCDPIKDGCRMEHLPEKTERNVQKENTTSEILPKKTDTVQFGIMHPVVSQLTFQMETNMEKRVKTDAARTFESCVKCVFSESSTFSDGTNNHEKSLPTMAEEQLVANHSDAEKQNASRPKRSVHSYSSHDWCRIERNMLNGDLDCTIWSYQKVCSINCHPGYTCKYNTFTCSRKTNSWNPALLPCEPASPYRSFGYRKMNDSLEEDSLNRLKSGNMRIHSYSKDTRKQLAPDDDIQIEKNINMYEKQIATKNSADKKLDAEKYSQDSEKIYSFFEKENPDTIPEDTYSWS